MLSILRVHDPKAIIQEANLVEQVEDSPDFWSGPVQSYNSPVEYRFLIGLDRSTNGPLPDCGHKYVSVRTMPPGYTARRFPFHHERRCDFMRHCMFR